MIRFEHCCFFIPMQTGAYMLGAYSLLYGVFHTCNYLLEHGDSMMPGLIITSAVLSYASGIILIIGTNRSWSKFVLVWVMLEVVLLNLSVIMVVASIVTNGFHNGIILYIVSAVLEIYFILCMLSYYHELGDSVELPE